MSSGFVSSGDLDEERRQRQEEWEKVRKPEDPQQAPEPEICNKTLFEQLRDNKEAKQAEFDEAKKFRNMIRGIDEDESDFLSQVDELKAQAHSQKKKEEEEVLKELASQRVITVTETTTLTRITPSTSGPPKMVKSSQASILSAVIKRKTPNDKSEDNPANKIARSEEVKPAVQARTIIGHIPGLVHYEASSDSDSNSSDSEPRILPSLQIAEKKKKNGHG